MSNCTTDPPLPDCPILPLDSTSWTVFNVLRFVATFFAILLSVYSLWRFWAVLHGKWINDSRLMALAQDAQLQTLLLSSGCFVCGIGSFIGHYVVLYYDDLLIIFAFSSFAFGSLAVARTTHFFVMIHSRFHPPSRHVGLAVMWLSFAFVISFIAAAVAHQAVLVQVIDLAYLICLVVGMTVFALAVLRVPSDPVLIRAQTPQSNEARLQLVLIVKVFLTAAVVLAFLLVVQVFSPSVVTIWIKFPQTVAAYIGMFLLVRLMGRSTARAESVDVVSSVKISTQRVARNSRLLRNSPDPISPAKAAFSSAARASLAGISIKQSVASRPSIQSASKGSLS